MLKGGRYIARFGCAKQDYLIQEKILGHHIPLLHMC